MFGYITVVTLLAGLLVVAIPGMAQTVPPVPQEKLTEVEQLKLQLATETQRRIQAEFKATMSLCQAEPAAREVLNSADSADAELKKLLQSFFDAHHLSPDQYKLDPTTFEFKKVP